MGDVPEVLTHEVGAGKFKLPLWQWAIAGVIGVYVARKASTLFSANSTADAPAEPTTLDDLIGAGGLGANGAVTVPVAGGGFDAGTSTQITDNDTWRIAANNYLTSVGADSLVVARAVDKYLDGDPLAPNEKLLIEKALRRLGPTPTPVTPPIVTPPNPKPPPPKPKPPPAPTPVAPIQQNTPNATIAPPKNAFEHFVDFCNAEGGRGTWWLTNLGGVYSAGTARYLGSPIGNGEHRSDWVRISSRFPIKGYTCVTANGHTRSYGG